MNKVDFNPKNYDIEELAAILKFETIPLNKGIIERRILELKRKFKNQDKYLNFFDKAKDRLLENLKQFNEQTWIDSYKRQTTAAGKVLEEQFQFQDEKEKKEKINQIINKEKDIIGIVKQPLDQNYAPKNVVQGTKNPFLITEIQRVINFDSHYRKFLNIASSSCETPEELQQRRLFNSTNYTVDLNQPLTGVVSITLDSLEIPNSWYTFSSDYGTSSLKIEWEGLTQDGNPENNNWILTIENGNYNQQQLTQTINKQIYDIQDASNNYIFRGYYNAAGNFQANIAGSDTSKFPFPLLELKYFAHNNKVKLFNYHPTVFTTPTVYWYFDALELNPCASNTDTDLPRPGGKVDYNLGWLLGFRSTNIKVYKYEYIPTGATFSSNNGSVTGQSRTPPEGVIVPSSSFGVQPVTGDEIWRGFSIPKSTIDIKGPQYFMITLDDFNNNKPNKDIVSLIDSVDNTLKLPDYINSQTMDSKYGLGQYEIGYHGVPGYECVDVADVGNNDRKCSTNDLNIDLSSNLTKAQIYTAEQINFFNKPTATTTTNRYNSPNPTDYLGRFSVNRNPLDWDTSITYKNPDPKLTERKYFGPVKLVKFRVKLINDKGFAVNLNDRDWSFSLIVNHLYQY